MSAARHIIALVQSFIENDDDRFISIALQIAAHEARQGHGRLANELKILIEQAQSKKSVIESRSSTVPIVQAKGDLANLLHVRYSNARLSQLILSKETEAKLQRVLLEYGQQGRLRDYGFSPRRKLLLIGPPGSGKSTTAEVLAGELKLPLFTVLYDGLIGKFMGETATRLRLIFEAMSYTTGVYFFDEFDALGTQRSAANDVGEMRRILNSFLQFIEEDESGSLIIAATNHVDLLDKALFRRFDDTISYQYPDEDEAKLLLQTKLRNFDCVSINWPSVVSSSKGLSQAEIIRAAEETAKTAILEHSETIKQEVLISFLKERLSTQATLKD
jgi:AAA+ superfamily predicted ATPase